MTSATPRCNDDSKGASRPTIKAHLKKVRPSTQSGDRRLPFVAEIQARRRQCDRQLAPQARHRRGPARPLPVSRGLTGRTAQCGLEKNEFVWYGGSTGGYLKMTTDSKKQFKKEAPAAPPATVRPFAVCLDFAG